MQIGGVELDFDLLNFLWVVVAFFINSQRQTIKEQNDKIKEQADRVGDLEKKIGKAATEQQLRDLFNQENGPIKQDIKELAKSINDSMRDFDSQIHILALDIARGERKAGNQQ